MDFFLGSGLCVLVAYVYWKAVGSNVAYIAMLCSGLLFGRRRSKIDSFSRRTKSGWRSISYEGIQQDRRILIEYRYQTTLHWPRPKESPELWSTRDELEIRIPLVQKFWLRM